MKTPYPAGVLIAGLTLAASAAWGVPPGGRMGAGGAMHGDPARMQKMQALSDQGMQAHDPGQRMQAMQQHMQQMQEMMKQMHAMPMAQAKPGGKMTPEQMQQRQSMMESRMQMMMQMMQQMLNQQQMMLKQQQESMKKH